MRLATTKLGRILLLNETDDTTKDITDDCLKAVVQHMKIEHELHDKNDDESFGYEYDNNGALHYFK